MLRQDWSPQQIAAILPRWFPDRPELRVSHETIYQTLFVQSRGELRRELTRHLRSGQTQRRPHGQTERRGRLFAMIPISARPPEVADRAVPGHWEGDLLLGARGQGCHPEVLDERDLGDGVDVGVLKQGLVAGARRLR